MAEAVGRGNCFPRHGHPFEQIRLKSRAVFREAENLETLWVSNLESARWEFALREMGFPCDQIPAALPHMSPGPIENRGATAPDALGKLVKISE